MSLNNFVRFKSFGNSRQLVSLFPQTGDTQGDYRAHPESRSLCAHSFQESCVIINHKRMSWVACVEFLLKQIGVSTSEAYLPSFSSAVKRKLINRFKANLTKTLSKSSDTNQGKLRTYAYFKTIFRKEKYLSIINNVDIRKCFMSFCISAHKSEIEVGRYKNIPASNRICKVCSSGEVED